ncbi:MAG: hypothetical protein SGILL_005910 [Bacillariaceae sp.]
MGAIWTKELLVYVPFTVDALNTMISFPMFVIKGKKWALENITTKDQEIPLSEADRPAFRQLWDLFLVAYEGYFGFTMSTLASIYLYPETIPCFGYSLFALYAYKLYALQTRDLGGAKDAQHDTKVKSIQYFFLPGYGGYCALHLMGLFGRH